MDIALSEPRRFTWIGRILRVAWAVVLTLLLLIFLIVSRWIEAPRPTVALRAVNGIDPVAMPAPPPPPPESQSQPAPPPPPTSTVELPKLDLTVDDMAPPIQAAMAENRLDIMMRPAEFATAQPQTKASSLFSASELDNQPRLLNRPSAPFPPNQLKNGVEEGKVTLDVMINVAGRVTIRSVISSSHPDFIPMAKKVATLAKFSPPKKDNRIVNAVFNWPLVLRP